MDSALEDSIEYGKKPYIPPVAGGDRVEAVMEAEKQYIKEKKSREHNSKMAINYIQRDCPQYLSR